MIEKARMTDPLEQSPNLPEDPSLIRAPDGWEKPHPLGIYIIRRINNIEAKIVANGSYGFAAFLYADDDLELFVSTEAPSFSEAVEWCNTHQPLYVRRLQEVFEKKMGAGWGLF